MAFFEKTIFTIKEVLTASSVDKVAESLEAYLASAKAMEETMVFKLRLTVDTILVQYLEKLPEGSNLELGIYQKFGRRYLRLTIAGSKVNPLEQEEEAEMDFAQTLLSSVDIVPQYIYKRRENIVLITLPTKPVSPLMLTVGGIVVALFTWAVFKFAGTPEIATKCVELLFHPLYTSILGLLNLAAMVMIFFSLLASFCNMTSSKALEKYGTLVFKNILGSIALTTVVSGIILSLVFGIINFTATNFSVATIQQVYVLFLAIIPRDIINPFLKGDALQITFLAVVVGILIVSIREKCTQLIGVINEISMLAITAVGKICSLLPIIVYLSFTELLLKETKAELSKVILIPLAVFFLCALMVIALFFYFQYKTGLRLKNYVQEATPLGVNAFVSASSLACYHSMENLCTKYSVRESVLRFALPLMQVFFKPGVAVMFSSGIMLLLYIYGITVSLPQFFILELTLFLITLACPTVPGGAIAMYALLIKHVGLPLEALSILLSVDIIIDMIGTAAHVLTIPSMIITFDRVLKVKDRI